MYKSPEDWKKVYELRAARQNAAKAEVVQRLTDKFGDRFDATTFSVDGIHASVRFSEWGKDGLIQCEVGQAYCKPLRFRCKNDGTFDYDKIVEIFCQSVEYTKSQQEQQQKFQTAKANTVESLDKMGVKVTYGTAFLGNGVQVAVSDAGGTTLSVHFRPDEVEKIQAVLDTLRANGILQAA
jgi:hypothetical protein